MRLLRTALVTLLLAPVFTCNVWAQEIFIGQIASRSQAITANNAIGMALGFDAYFSRINAAGGVLGRRVTLENFDDHASVEESLKLADQVAADIRVLALFGQSTSAQLSELVKSKTLINNDLALIAPLSGMPALAGARNVFPVRANYFDEIDKIANHLGATYRKKVAFLYLYNPMGEEMQARLAAGLKRFDGVVTVGVAINATQDKDKMTRAIEAATDKALDTRPDAIVAFGPGNIGPELVRHVRASKGQPMNIYLMSISGYGELIKSVGLNAAKGVMISQALPMPTDTRLKIVKQYLADLAKYAPEAKPSYLSLEGYIGARVLHEALRRAGPNPNRASLLKALESMGNFDAGDFEVKYASGGKSVDSAVDITMISGTGYLIH